MTKQRSNSKNRISKLVNSSFGYRDSEGNRNSNKCRPASRLGKKPKARNAANARERARMRVLSKAFNKLKTALPWVPPDTKLSKLDTLRLASGYIQHLMLVLDEEEQRNQSEEGHSYGNSQKKAPVIAPKALNPSTLIWPFTLHNKTISDMGLAGSNIQPFSMQYSSRGNLRSCESGQRFQEDTLDGIHDLRTSSTSKFSNCCQHYSSS